MPLCRGVLHDDHCHDGDLRARSGPDDATSWLVPTIVAMSVVEGRVGVVGLVVIVVAIGTACAGSGRESSAAPSSVLGAVPGPSSTDTTGSSHPDPTGIAARPSAAVKGRPHLDAAVASGDLCEANDALDEMVETSHDGLEVASEMRDAAEGADSARDIVPDSILDAWDVVAASTRRYADALVSAGGDASVPEVQAIRQDAAFERASSRVAAWIRDHCGDDGS